MLTVTSVSDTGGSVHVAACPPSHTPLRSGLSGALHGGAAGTPSSAAQPPSSSPKYVVASTVSGRAAAAGTVGICSVAVTGCSQRFMTTNVRLPVPLSAVAESPNTAVAGN